MMSSRAIAWRKLRFRFDWTLPLAMLAMVALGLVNLWSALQDRGPQLFSKQISLLAVGIGMFLAVAAFDYRAISRIGYWLYGLHEYQRKRVEARLNPDSAEAWQSRQARNAIGAGRFLGKGFLQATQIRIRRLPALWTDFPFAVWAEEWGFVGCLIVLAGYLILILWTLKIASEARDRFGATVCVGVATKQNRHVAVNVGMVTGVLPVVGVTLPLISYGGSSLLTIMAALGLVMNVSIRRFAY